MAYSVLPVQTTGDLITGTIWNTQVNTINAIAYGGFVIPFDGGGGTLSTDLTQMIPFTPFKMTFTDATVTSSDVGDVIIDILVPPTTSDAAAASDSIVGAAPPTLSCDSYYHDGTLSGWTKTVAAGSRITFRVKSALDIEKCYLEMNYVRSS